MVLAQGGGRVDREDMMSQRLRLLGSTTLTSAWSLVSSVGVFNGYKHSWGLQWHLQVQWLGIRARSGGGQTWWCAHTRLWGPAAGACGVAGSSFIYACGKCQDQQQEPKPTAGTLAVTNDLAVTVHSHSGRVSPWAHTWQ